MGTFKYEVRSTKYEVRREDGVNCRSRSSVSVLRTLYFVLRTFSIAVPVLTFPDLALACPVCGFGTGENGWAYVVMSAILSALPLGMIVAGTVWLSRRVKQHDDQDGAGRPPRGSSKS